MTVVLKNAALPIRIGVQQMTNNQLAAAIASVVFAVVLLCFLPLMFVASTTVIHAYLVGMFFVALTWFILILRAKS